MERITLSYFHLWFDDYRRTSPGAANLAPEVSRHIFNHAVKQKQIAISRARGVKPNPLPKHAQFLSREGIKRVHETGSREPWKRRSSAVGITFISVGICTCSKKIKSFQSIANMST